MARPVLLAFSLFSGLVAAQAPEFGQQYRQRLGGAYEELSRVVADFDGDAARAGFDRSGALAAMAASPDELIRLRAASMERAFDRHDHLRRQLTAFENGDVLDRLRVMVSSPDPALVGATWRTYEPAVPATPAGLVSAGIGFGVIYVLFRALGMTLRRPKRSRRPPEQPNTIPIARPRTIAWDREEL